MTFYIFGYLLELHVELETQNKFKKTWEKISKKGICDRMYICNFVRLKICEILPIVSNLSQTLLTIGIQEKRERNMNI
jgi:hypothetical protein